MFTLGFDVAKNYHDVALTNDSGVVKQTWHIPNTTVAVINLLNDVKSKHPKLRAGCEATGIYHYSVLQACLQLGLPCKLINPLTTKQFTRSTIRGRKTDQDDALSIARLVARGEGVTVTSSLLSPARDCSRLSTKIGQHVHALKLEARFLNDRGLPIDPIFVTAIDSLDSLSKRLRKQALGYVDKHDYELLTSLTGIGPAIAVSLSAEIGDIHRFKSAKALVAYAGLDPRVRQSGTVLHRNTKLTKRGSSELRHSLFLAANIARQHDRQLKAYYQKKRLEGRTYTEATVATARKVSDRVFAVLTRGTPYIKST